MNSRKARAARRAAPPVLPKQKQKRPTWTTGRIALAAAAVVAVLVASFVLPGVLGEKSNDTAASHAGMAMGAEPGTGLPVGASVPAFSERDVERGTAITSKSVYGRKTLLFFSEGVMCQACFEQIKGLEQLGGKLDARGIQLISVTPDSSAELRQAIGQYGIQTPMIADDNRDMSRAFNTLGQGMHGDTPGHAFVLIDKGKVLWYHDYWLAPTKTMYVDPQRVLADMNAA